jgi:hypothetical protein
MGEKSAVMGAATPLLEAEEAKFTGRAVGAETVGEVEGGSGSGGDGGVGPKSTEGKKAGGFVEAEADSQLAGGGAENAAAESRVEGAEAV